MGSAHAIGLGGWWSKQPSRGRPTGRLYACARPIGRGVWDPLIGVRSAREQRRPIRSAGRGPRRLTACNGQRRRSPTATAAGGGGGGDRRSAGATERSGGEQDDIGSVWSGPKGSGAGRLTGPAGGRAKDGVGGPTRHRTTGPWDGTAARSGSTHRGRSAGKALGWAPLHAII